MSNNPRLSFIGQSNPSRKSLIPSNNVNLSDKRRGTIRMEPQKPDNNLELMDQQLKYLNQYNQVINNIRTTFKLYLECS